VRRASTKNCLYLASSPGHETELAENSLYSQAGAAGTLASRVLKPSFEKQRRSAALCTVSLAYRLELEQQITEKLDISTSHILSNIEKYASGKQSKQLAYGSDELSLKFAIWMNIHALARYRPIEVEFAEVNMGLTIPKSLILNLLAARMLCFSYSHCAALFNSSQVDKLDPDAIAKLAAVSHQRWREPRKVVVPAGVITNKPPYHSRFETAADGTRVDTANTEFADLPKSLKKRFEEKATLAYKWKVAHERTVSLTSFGNTLVVELLGLPMVAKKLKRWTLQQITEEYDDKVHRLSYPLDGTTTTIQQPIKVYFKLAETTLLRDTPQVGWWDSAKQDWSTVGISEVKVETVASGENGVLRFHTVHVGHFRIVQPRNLDIPYHYWEVKPYGSKGALMLVIITRHHENGAQREIKISVTEGGCTLLSPTDLQLKPMIGQLMSAREIISRLVFSGICLSMSDQDASAISGVNPKNHVMEQKLHTDIATMGFGFHLSKSKWNQTRSANSAVFRVREQEVEHSFTVLCEYDEEAERHFKCSLTKTKETSKKFHTTPIDGEMTHSRLWSCVSSRCMAETESMVEAGDVRVIENMRTLLDITRPCTFS